MVPPSATGPDAAPRSRSLPPALAAVEVPEILSLRDALALALAHHPGLGALALEVEARAGAEVQAGVYPNPTLTVDVENFGRSRRRLGQLNGPEYTLAVGQLVELGGKRTARVRAARLERQLALWDYESARASLLAVTARDFVSVLTGQQQVELAEEGLRLGLSVRDAVRAKVAAGKVSPVEATRAEVLVSRARLEVDRAGGELAASRARLAAQWGQSVAGFKRAIGVLAEAPSPPPLEVLFEEVAGHPDVARWADEVEHREASMELARAGRIPDPTVSAGGRFLDETDESAFVVGISLPLSVNDRRTGAIEEAARRLDQARARRQAAWVSRRSDVVVAHTEVANALRQLKVLETEILPATAEAHHMTREAYLQGRAGLTDVLETERTWFATRLERLDALRRYHAHRAELETLVGHDLNEMTNRKTES